MGWCLEIGTESQTSGQKEDLEGSGDEYDFAYD